MAQYEVTKPIAGHVTITVEADSIEDAIVMANSTLDNVEVLDREGLSMVDADMEWEFYDPIVQGNVFMPQYNEVEVDLIEG